MSERDRHLRHKSEWIEGAKMHRMCQMLDRYFRLAEINSHPTAKMPRLGELRLGLEGPIDESRADFAVVDNIGKRKSSPSQRDRVIPPQLRRTASQSCGFGSLFHPVYYPTTSLTPDVTPR